MLEEATDSLGRSVGWGAKLVLSIQFLMIRIRLREAMKAHRQRTGVKLTYDILAARTGLSIATLQSLAARPDYNPRLSTIEKLCVALECAPADLLELSTGKGRGT
jgi:DNA-binding Xre family transcriptional regulator